MSVFAGVDGGGTRTRAVLIDGQGRELGRAEVDGAVVTVRDPGAAADAVARAVVEAAADAGSSLPVGVLWAGLAGAGAGRARAAVTGALQERELASHLVVGTDVEAAFHDAFGTGPGILLIAGTGSVVWARDESGIEYRIGGWGQHLGDEGGGYTIGLDGLRAVVRADDGRTPPTALTGPLLERCRVETVQELVGWVDTATKRAVASLAPTVLEIAARGDEAASVIAEDAVDALRTHLEAAVARMGLAAGGTVPDVVLWGGLVAPGGPLAGRVRQALEVMGLDPVDRVVDPAMGAARLASAAAG